MKRVIWVFALAIVASLLGHPASAREDWEQIAIRTPKTGTNRDVIRVGSELGRFSQLYFRARNGDIVVFDIEIEYEDGRTQRKVLDERLRADADPLYVELDRGASEYIKKVVVNYRARRNNSGSATLLSVAGKSEGGVPGMPPGWEVLETREYNTGASLITVTIGGQEGGFRAIRFRALDQPVSIRGITMVYGNGERDFERFAARLSRGEVSDAVDVEGRRRAIQRVEVAFETPARGEGRLQILGRRDRDRRIGDLDDRRDRIDRDRRSDRGGTWSRQITDQRVPRGWVLFGTHTVGFRGERDVIKVGRQVGQFEKLSLRVLDNGIHLRELVVVYENGERDVREADVDIPANSRTAEIPLRGDRFVREIELVYRALPSRRGEATVEIYGEYSDGWIGERGRRRDHNDGWLMLGAQRVTPLTVDRDAFEVGERLGRFRALRIVARQNEVRILGMRVTYGNGDTAELPVSARLKEGQATEPIPLGDRGRRIDRIEIMHRGKLSLRSLAGAGVVEVWGLQ